MSTTANKSGLDEDIDFNYNFGNFNPDDVEVEDTINVQFVVDVSGSVTGYVSELNSGFNEFVERMQKSHVADKVFVSVVIFNDRAQVLTGYQPISQVPTIDFGKHITGMTALYGGTKVALENALNYREGLENAGVNCKTLVFVMTDGGDNRPQEGVASDVKSIIDNLLQEERNFASFETMLFGINKSEKSTFESAAADMGIKNVVTIDNTADEIKKMINFISSSVSSASGNGNAISVANF
jgi:uncharacterized protein YegL